jgi:hypothetical protein
MQPVLALLKHPQPHSSLVVPCWCHKEASAGLAATAHPPAQLMQLGEAEAVR